jgi:tRNA G18 (ribose-2'-O)-methylase SpoU
VTPASTSVAGTALAIRIDDPHDPRLADYMAVRERDLAGRDGGFIAEGVVVIDKLLAAGRHPVRSVLVAEHRLGSLTDLLARAPADAPVYAAAQAVMDAVVGFHIHRGVLAAGRRREVTPEALLAGLPAQALVVALLGIANHDNMGGLFRNAAAFGAEAVVLASDCCDPLYRKAIRVSVGATLTVPFARLGRGGNPAEVLARAGFEVLALSPGGEVRLEQVGARPRQAVLFGAEGPGLPAEVLSRARSVRIPMAAGFDSLNVATASGIALNHLAGIRRGAL